MSVEGHGIGPTKLDAKNWLFIGCREAGQRAAILYTIIENCRRLKIETREYIEDVLTRLPGMKESEVVSLIPANWPRDCQGKPPPEAQTRQGKSHRSTDHAYSAVIERATSLLNSARLYSSTIGGHFNRLPSLVWS